MQAAERVLCAVGGGCAAARACEQSCTVMGGNGEKNEDKVKSFTYYADCPYEFTYVLPLPPMSLPSPHSLFAAGSCASFTPPRLLILAYSRRAVSQD